MWSIAALKAEISRLFHLIFTMGKRKGDQKGGNAKKFRAGGIIEPNTSGIYATCNRGREQQCRKELMNLFSEKIEEYYTPEQLENAENDEDEAETASLSIEDQIKKELAGLKENKQAKKALLVPIELGCECMVFIKTRRPLDPETFVERICSESAESRIKNTRYTQKLTPVQYSVTPTLEELKKLAARVLGPHFHKKEGQAPVRFAIQVNRRNFNSLERPLIIRTIAESVGRDHGHSVDLKAYEKLVLVECYKSNIGMSVANRYDELDKFNLQQIFEKRLGDGELSRVKKSTGEGEKGKKEGEKQEIEKGKGEENQEEGKEEAKAASEEEK